jgi:hypothetical protein
MYFFQVMICLGVILLATVAFFAYWLSTETIILRVTEELYFVLPSHPVEIGEIIGLVVKLQQNDFRLQLFPADEEVVSEVLEDLVKLGLIKREGHHIPIPNGQPLEYYTWMKIPRGKRARPLRNPNVLLRLTFA